MFGYPKSIPHFMNRPFPATPGIQSMTRSITHSTVIAPSSLQASRSQPERIFVGIAAGTASDWILSTGSLPRARKWGSNSPVMSNNLWWLSNLLLYAQIICLIVEEQSKQKETLKQLRCQTRVMTFSHRKIARARTTECQMKLYYE